MSYKNFRMVVHIWVLPGYSFLCLGSSAGVTFPLLLNCHETSQSKCHGSLPSWDQGVSLPRLSLFSVARELAPGLLYLIRGSGGDTKLPWMYRAAPKWGIFQPRMLVLLKSSNLALWVYIAQSVSGASVMPKIAIIPDWWSHQDLTEQTELRLRRKMSPSWNLDSISHLLLK